MKQFVTTAWMAMALAACSSSSTGGGEGGAGGGSSSTSTAASTPGGAGGAAGSEWDPHGAPLLVWTGLQGSFDSVGQEPHLEGGPIPPSARRLVGCAVDAPELGEYVVYLERAAMEDDAMPDRQFLVVLDDPGVSGPGGHFAAAFIGRPVNPEEWAGACVVGTTLPLLGEVVRDPACELNLVRNEVATVSVTAAAMPAECVSASLDATSVKPSLLIHPAEISWLDTLDGGDGGPRHDPPSDPSGDNTSYELVRRSP